jgi:molecular chaperone GrpE (heat shock protein)
MALQKGYLLNNRLLRPALVIIAKASAPAPGPSA